MEEMKCEEVRVHLADFREKKVKHPLKGMIERHLYYCPDCIFHLALITAKSLDHNRVPVGYES